MTLAQLLVVQDHDTSIDRLEYSLKNLPEFVVLTSLDDEQEHLESQREVVAEQRHVVSREQKRLEDDAALLTARIDLENLRLYDGSVTGHKELQAIQDEINVLGRRRSDLEDLILEQMVAGEPLDAALDDFDQKLANVENRRTEATMSMHDSQERIAGEIEAEQAERGLTIGEVGDDLVREYESSRAACGGVGICRLIDKTCQGCHLTLPAVEYDRIRKEPAESIVRCGECNRILVR